jgi:glycine cleavage system H protein
MSNVKYSEEHEWVRVEAGIGTVGITAYAQEQLGDVVFVDLPPAARIVAKGEACAVVESVKAASDIYAPVSGEIVEANAALGDAPGDVNAEPMGKGWFFRIRLSDPSELDALMDEAAYQAFVKSLA